MGKNLNDFAEALDNLMRVSKECGFKITSLSIRSIEEPEEENDRNAETKSAEPEVLDVEEPTYGEYKLRDEIEKELIKDALIRNHNSRSAAAKELQLSERTLIRKIKQYNLDK